MTSKRLFDLILTTPALLVISPVLLVLAIWIRFDSPGEIFFKQQRVGRKGKPFRLYKFRTMVKDAEKLGSRVTAAGDTRITRSGRFLRRTKLDELPQLVNVLKGEMSLVGPRPEVPEYVACWPENDREIILSVKPGITDYATVEFRDEEKILAREDDPREAYVRKILPVKVELYRKYVQNNNIMIDLWIILQTLKKIVRPG